MVEFSDNTQDICKDGIFWPISVAEEFPTGVLLIYVECFAENSLFTDLGIPWGSGDFGEHVPDVHQRRRTKTFRIVFSYLVTRSWIFLHCLIIM